MSRSRNIKPGLWLNEDLAEVSIPARYLFPGLWCLADKEGRLEYRPKKIKVEIYPYDKVCVISLIAELHGKQFISVYESEGKLYIQINNFVKHQNPHPKEKTIGYPEPLNICEYDGNLKQFNFTASNVQIPFPSSSLIPSSLIPSSDGSSEMQQHSEQQEDPVLVFPVIGLKDGFSIYQKDVDNWQFTFSGVQVFEELKVCRQWNIDNPTKRKTITGIRKHISSWLGKAQNSGQKRNTAQKPMSTKERDARRLMGLSDETYP